MKNNKQEKNMKEIVLSKIENVMDENLKVFLTNIEYEYKIPKDTLWKKWKDGEKTTINVIKKENNKKSDYQIFFSIQRNKMVKENPNITFGEISKQVSSMWKKLGSSEKLKYSSDVVKNTLPSPPSFDTLRTEYLKMPTNDLKNICKEKGITAKFRKKDDIINALVEWEEKKQQTSLVFKQDEITKGRSKLELSVEDKDEEEEDYYFHDDGSSTSDDESRVCDDDTGILTSDDEDIFGDDD